MKISNYSLNYAALIAERTMDVFQFLALCRELGLEGASLHLQNLQSTQPDYLKQIRRAYLDHGLSVSIFTVSTDFGQPEEKHEEEFKKFRQALRAAELLGAPLIRVFPGSPRSEADRQNAFDRAAAAVRRACEEAAQAGVPIGLQNHNHGALCRTGEEVIRFIKKVDHPNFTFVLDTGQFAGSQGASGQPPAELRDANFMESIRQTASLARYVRVKFYSPETRRERAGDTLRQSLRHSARRALFGIHRYRLRTAQNRRQAGGGCAHGHPTGGRFSSLQVTDSIRQTAGAGGAVRGS